MRWLLLILIFIATFPNAAFALDVATDLDVATTEFVDYPAGCLSYEYVKVTTPAQLAELPESTKAIHCYAMLDRDLAGLSRFKNLEALQVGRHPADSTVRGAFLQHLQKLRKLKVLRVPRIEAQYFKHLTKLKTLEELQLSATKGVEQIMPDIFEFRNLQHLSVPLGFYGDALAGISKCRKLKGLALGASIGPDRSDTALPVNTTELLKLKGLEALSIHIHGFSEAVLDAVKQFITQQKNLQWLTMRNNGEQFSMDLTLKNLRKLHLCSPPSGKWSIPDVETCLVDFPAPWLESLKSCRQLRVLAVHHFDNDVGALLKDSDLSVLEALSVYSLPEAPSEDIPKVFAGPSLRTIAINFLEVERMFSFGSGGALQELRIGTLSGGARAFGPALVAHASRLSIQKLICRTSQFPLTQNVLKELGSYINLVHLEFHAGNWPDDLSPLGTLSKLQVVRLFDNTRYDADGAESELDLVKQAPSQWIDPFTKLESLRELHLDTLLRVFTPKVLEKVGTMKQLELLHVELMDEPKAADLEHLAALSNLRGLSIEMRTRDSGLSADAVNSLARVPALKSLRLGRLTLKDDEAASAIALLRSLESINIDLDEHEFPAAAAFKAFADLPRLRGVYVDSRFVSAEHVQVLRRCETLTFVNVRNRSDDALAKALQDLNNHFQTAGD